MAYTYDTFPRGEYPQVDYYAGLPGSPVVGDIYVVLNPSGIWPFTYHASGFYVWNGSIWNKFDDLQEILNNTTITDINGWMVGNGNVVGTAPYTPADPQYYIPFNNNIAPAYFYENTIYWGQNNDMGIVYNNSQGIGFIGTDGNQPSDLQVECGNEKTIVLRNSVWVEAHGEWLLGLMNTEDLTSSRRFGFAGDEYIPYLSIDPRNERIVRFPFEIELPHTYKEHTDIFLHVHFSDVKTPENEGDTAVFDVRLWQANVYNQDYPTGTNFSNNGIYNLNPSFTVDRKLEPWEHLKTIESGYHGTLIEGSKIKMSNMLYGTIAWNGHSNWTSEICLLRVDIHCECDTMGSREGRAKDPSVIPI